MSSTPELTHRVLRHERLVVAGGIALLAFLSWLFVLGGAGMNNGAAMAPMQPPLGALVMMWWVMMAAMMLPSAAPAILLYGRVRNVRSRDPTIANSCVFLLGYLAVWMLFSIIAASAQWLLIGPSMAVAASPAAAAMLIAAGGYQLSPLKAACVRQCRSPVHFITRHWQPGPAGAVRLGVMHGAYCLGCCWLLMALLFVGGIMNPLWIAGLTIMVALEKLAPGGQFFGRVAGVALIGWGLAKSAGF